LLENENLGFETDETRRICIERITSNKAAISSLLSDFARHKTKLERSEPDVSTAVIWEGWTKLRTEHEIAEQLAARAFKLGLNHESDLAARHSDVALAGLMNYRKIFRDAMRRDSGSSCLGRKTSSPQRQKLMAVPLK